MNKIFRRVLNYSMLIALLGAAPYIVTGQTQYRHEVFGTAALALVLFHCIENRLWFARSLNAKSKKEPSGAKRFRDWVNLLLTISALALLVSGVMISNVVFRFLGIPYLDFWHYTHFVFGVLFLALVVLHIFNRKL